MDSTISGFRTVPCVRCRNLIRVPVDPCIDVVACVCGYYTEVPHE